MREREVEVAQDRRPRKRRKPIPYLSSHSGRYVTTSELAEYWAVSRKQIYKQIEAGTLPAIRLGPRLFRIRTQDALEFEESAKIGPPASTERVGRLSTVETKPVKMEKPQVKSARQRRVRR